ncbi:7991_t:CDS:2 [Acaulospora colombiana]|uniref:7991_t:CDS:1 n=1 Tax=Acaulospora colombiana TaxID=27376 RepID=A0ACA9KIY4_9GLOM|nr:7991_t:CDS:2 [Acaulospora colombiana]
MTKFSSTVTILCHILVIRESGHNYHICPADTVNVLVTLQVINPNQRFFGNNQPFLIATLHVTPVFSRFDTRRCPFVICMPNIGPIYC